MILAGEMTLEPDYSWVPEGLSNFVGGLLSAALLILPIVLAIGFIAWLWTLVTGPRWDNAVGQTRTATVLLCIVLVGTLAGGVGWGMKTIGTTNVDTSVSSMGSSVPTPAQNARRKIDKAVEKLKKGDIVGAAGSALSAGGDMIKVGIDAASGMIDKAKKAVKSGIDKVGKAFSDASSWLSDHSPFKPRK